MSIRGVQPVFDEEIALFARRAASEPLPMVADEWGECDHSYRLFHAGAATPRGAPPASRSPCSTTPRSMPELQPLPLSLPKDSSRPVFAGFDDEVGAEGSWACPEDPCEPPPDDEGGSVHELLRPPRAPRTPRVIAFMEGAASDVARSRRGSLGQSKPDATVSLASVGLQSLAEGVRPSESLIIEGRVPSRGVPAGWSGCSPSAMAFVTDARQLAAGCASSLSGADFERSEQDRKHSNSSLRFHPQPEGDDRRRRPVDVIEHASEVLIIHR